MGRFKVFAKAKFAKINTFNYYRTDIDWIKIRKKLQIGADFVINLEPARLYDIRVTAHNGAGITVADYTVATLAERGTYLAKRSNKFRFPSMRIKMPN